ncbi:MAG: hypothetical protein ACRCZ2_06990, partial [Fusobacteriaceae bacterium]
HIKWQTETTKPFNPTDKRGLASINLDGEILEIPVNIRETPLQSVNKFFIYELGNMTERNLAVGGYGNQKEEGDLNKVRVDFEIDLSDENFEKIKNYAEKKNQSTGDKIIEIPYDSSSGNHHFIHAIKGFRTEEFFLVDEENILEEIHFPKIKFLLEHDLDNTPTNNAKLTFNGPIPKSNISLSGTRATFDILKPGKVSGNNMILGYENPEVLEISSDFSENWNGYTVIPEVHKIEIYINGTLSRTELSNVDGYISRGVSIKSSENTYDLIKGKTASLAIGINQWDLKSRTDDIIELRHLNDKNRVVAKDRYIINIAEINILDYLENNLYLDPQDISKISITGLEKEIYTVNLGSLKLKNIDKFLTINNFDPKGVKITLPTTELELKTIVNNKEHILKGILKFKDNSTEIIDSNISKNVVFIIQEGEPLTPNIYKGFLQDKIQIQISTKNHSLANSLELSWISQDEMSGGFFKYTSTLTPIIIKQSEIKFDNKELLFPGKLRMEEISNYWKGTTQKKWTNLTPVISVTNDSTNMKKNFGETENLSGFNGSWGVSYSDGNEKFDAQSFLWNEFGESSEYDNNNSIPNFNPAIVKRISSDSLNLLISQTGKNPKSSGQHIRGNPSKENLESSVGLRLDSTTANIFEDIMQRNPDKYIFKFKPIDGRKLSMYANPFDTNEGNHLLNNALDSYSQTPNPIKSEVSYVDYPDIVLLRDFEYSKTNLTVNKKYIDESIIYMTKNNINYNPPGVTSSFDGDRFPLGLKYYHAVTIKLPTGEIKLFETDSNGNLETGAIVLRDGESSAELYLKFTADFKTEIWFENIVGNQDYKNIKVEHIDSEYNMILKKNVFDINLESRGNSLNLNKLELLISSRYNGMDNGLNSSPLLVTSSGIKFSKDTLDLKVISGEQIIHKSFDIRALVRIDEDKEYYFDDKPQDLELKNSTIRFSRSSSTGDITIKPLKWTHGSKDNFTLIYKDSEGNDLEVYSIDVVLPEFFVAYSGELDFGKVRKGGKDDVLGKTNIKLEFNDADIKAEYSLDIAANYIPDNNPTVDLSRSLYLNDDKTLLVKDL